MHEHHLLMDAGADGTTPSSINTTECNVVDCLQQQSQTHHATVGDEETSLIREKKYRLEEEDDGWIVLSVPCTNEIDATTVSIEICADYAIEAATTNKLQLRDKVIRDKKKTCEQFEASVKSSTQVHDSNTVQQDIADVDERPEIIEEHVKVATAQLQKLSCHVDESASRQQIESDYELQSVMDRLTKFVAVRDEQICTRQINLQGVEERTQVNDNSHNGNEEYKSAELFRILKEKLSKILDAITKVVERQIPTETKAMMIFLNHLQNKMRKKFQQNNTLATITALHKTISNIESRLLETEIYPMSREHTPNNNISSGYNEHISEFMIVTGTDDATKAAAYIEMSDNDVQIAIGLYMDGLLEKSIDQLNNNANDNSDSVKPVCFWDMFSPPIHLTHKSGGFAGAQTMAQQTKRFLLVNVQRDGEFSCHALNRDVWRDELVENIIREGFVFWQPMDLSKEGRAYTDQYSVDSFPHIGILDPRTGELLFRKEGWTQENPVTAKQFVEIATDISSHYSFEQPPKRKRLCQSGSSEAPAASLVQRSERRVELVLIISILKLLLTLDHELSYDVSGTEELVQMYEKRQQSLEEEVNLLELAELSILEPVNHIANRRK